MSALQGCRGAKTLALCAEFVDAILQYSWIEGSAFGRIWAGSVTNEFQHESDSARAERGTARRAHGVLPSHRYRRCGVVLIRDAACTATNRLGPAVQIMAEGQDQG